MLNMLPVDKIDEITDHAYLSLKRVGFTRQGIKSVIFGAVENGLAAHFDYMKQRCPGPHKHPKYITEPDGAAMDFDPCFIPKLGTQNHFARPATQDASRIVVLPITEGGTLAVPVVKVAFVQPATYTDSSHIVVATCAVYIAGGLGSVEVNGSVGAVSDMIWGIKPAE